MREPYRPNPSERESRERSPEHDAPGRGWQRRKPLEAGPHPDTSRYWDLASSLTGECTSVASTTLGTAQLTPPRCIESIGRLCEARFCFARREHSKLAATSSPPIL